MKIQAITRMSFNTMRNLFLHLTHRNKFQYHYLSFCSPKSSFRVGKGEMVLGRSIQAEGYCYFSTQSGGCLIIGDNTFFNHHCQVISRGSVSIGKNCIFGPFVSIYDHDHEFGAEGVLKNQYKVRDVSIGDNCWVGEKVTILRGTTIGEGCVIGAGCIVSGNIPPHTLVKPQRDYVYKTLDNSFINKA